MKRRRWFLLGLSQALFVLLPTVVLNPETTHRSQSLALGFATIVWLYSVMGIITILLVRFHDLRLAEVGGMASGLWLVTAGYAFRYPNPNQSLLFCLWCLSLFGLFLIFAIWTGSKEHWQQNGVRE